jgi:RNA polymerase sporulation-specific sigma factor
MGNSRLSEKEALITFNRMAIKLARKYSTFYEFDDLFQIAQISIVEAVRSYDSKRGASLSTHIYNSIDFNIKKLINKNKIYYINNQETNINEPYYSDFSDNKLNSLILSDTFNDLIDDLSLRQKEILFMKFVDGLTIKEISYSLECSHQNVSNIIKTIRKILVNKLEKQGLKYQEFSF